MEIKDVLVKVKGTLSGFKVQTVLIVLLSITVATLGWTAYWKPKSVDTQRMLSELRETLTEKFDQSIKERDVKIKDLSNRLIVSNGKYKALVKKQKELRDASAKIELPKTNKELRARFVALGFPPR